MLRSATRGKLFPFRQLTSRRIPRLSEVTAQQRTSWRSREDSQEHRDYELMVYQKPHWHPDRPIKLPLHQLSPKSLTLQYHRRTRARPIHPATVHHSLQHPDPPQNPNVVFYVLEIYLQFSFFQQLHMVVRYGIPSNQIISTTFSLNISLDQRLVFMLFKIININSVILGLRLHVLVTECRI